MPVEVAMNTPLAEALHRDIQPKLIEYGWAPSDASDATMAEYLILMIVNGKTEDEIAAELASDLLNLSPDDNSAKEFAKWLFETIDARNAEINGVPQSHGALSEGGDQDMDMDVNADVNVPTGPKSMRNGAGFRGGRDKRVMGQINRAMDRNIVTVLHRVRGSGGAGDRINTHARGPTPAGPRNGSGFGAGRPQQQHQQQRNLNNRTNQFNQAMASMAAGGPASMAWMGQPGQPGMAPNPMDMFAMLEQQSRMMQQMQEQMQQQMMQQQQQHQQQNRRGGFHNGRGNGRPLADRIQYPHKNFRGQGGPNGGHENGGAERQQHHSSHGGGDNNNGDNAKDGDVDMLNQALRDVPNPAETVCKYNLNCSNKDCKFAHQSPAAPPGVTVDVHDLCPYAAACKNKKCVARHPSPAARIAHQSEQDCKFFPNCTNPHCPFRHPSMPLCRNGGDCAVPGCKFTHIKTMCKYRPCTNRFCTFKHEEGQRGVFPDKVWTAEGGEPGSGVEGGKSAADHHISERKFVDETAPEENVFPETENDMDKDMSAEVAAA